MRLGERSASATIRHDMSPCETEFLTFFELPFGFAAAIASGGALTRLALFEDGGARGAWIERHAPGARNDDDAAPFGALREQLDGYCRTSLSEFDLPLRLVGTPFQQEVWGALLQIPRGETTTYARLARSLGRPRAVRAVGQANGRNPISVVVPCHRVIGASGELTGYAGGIGIKRRLLAFEGALPEAAAETLPLFGPPPFGTP